MHSTGAREREPAGYGHATRSRRRLRAVGLLLLVAWALLAALAIYSAMTPSPFVVAGLCAIGVYFIGAGLWRQADPE